MFSWATISLWAFHSSLQHQISMNVLNCVSSVNQWAYKGYDSNDELWQKSCVIILKGQNLNASVAATVVCAFGLFHNEEIWKWQEMFHKSVEYFYFSILNRRGKKTAVASCWESWTSWWNTGYCGALTLGFGFGIWTENQTWHGELQVCLQTFHRKWVGSWMVCCRNPWILTASELPVYERLTYSFYPPCQSVFLSSLIKDKKGCITCKSWGHF